MYLYAEYFDNGHEGRIFMGQFPAEAYDIIFDAALWHKRDRIFVAYTRALLFELMPLLSLFTALPYLPATFRLDR